MLDATVNLIQGVLATDATMDDCARKDFMGLVHGFRNGGGPKEAPPTRCVSYKEAARRLGCSPCMVRYMRKRRILVGVRLAGTRFHGVTEESLSAHINALRGLPRPKPRSPGRPRKAVAA